MSGHLTDDLLESRPTALSGILYGSNGQVVAGAADVNYSPPLTFGGGMTRTVNAVALDATGPGAGAIGTTGVKSITLDAKGRVTAASPSVRGTDYDLPYDAEEYYKKLAASRLGVSAKNLLFFWFPFYAIGVGGRSTVSNGSGTDSILAQGWHLETGTTNSSYRSYPFNFGTFGATTAQKNLIAGAGKKWWSCIRMALSGSTWSSGEYAGSVGSDIVTANRLIVGVHGATSTTKFAAYSDTAALTSTVDLDTAERVHEAWRDGSTGNYAIDEGTAVQGDLRPTADCAMLAIQVANASSGNHNRGVDVFWSAFATIKGG